ncbi:DUF3168 domain-containing protein [Poseidonocella sedimentorum]|uniref:DUF3168 domain-containing protein n=1 Tax=Poseidonocella sedimentorum TaxID=871652 RepID=A0A1I6DH30_9RHOB|nr:DUF3168 domain-containing protein [Poseidonocella sedimentorum]SFR04755.1 Protein of unknown function [Poseidonocella sedimentorum]
MSYGVSAALQAAVFQHLAADADISAATGGAIYDAMPPGAVPDTYVTLGPEEVQDRSDISARGAEHRFTVSVVTDTAGFAKAKTIAGAIGDALDGPALTLSRGRLVSLNFTRAVARRGDNGAERRIDLTFRARVEDD